MSSSIETILTFYAAPLAAIWVVYAIRRHRAEARAISQKNESREAGLDQPASLHPVIDALLCTGCKACINACPEGSILGLIRNKAHLVEPSNCIGHGACKTACPQGAISLVFGTETRGVDLPVVMPDFQSNVPGIYIAGELGGMGLIRNAIEQGRQAMESIAARSDQRSNGMLDVAIVGSGPAGISAGLSAISNKLSYVIIEQESLGGTVAHFPRGKIVMTSPAKLPIVGTMKFKEVGKERLLQFWQQVVRKTGLKINSFERVDAVFRHAGGFLVQTTRSQYAARNVLLAIGRRGTPRRLGVPGEDLPKVLYRLIDPQQFRGKTILVVGGGDSALEAAASLAEEAGTAVTLSYRGDGFSRAKAKNRERVEHLSKLKKLNILLSSEVAEIREAMVAINHRGRVVTLPNDTVIVCAGGILPTDFLRTVGIEIETKYGTA